MLLPGPLNGQRVLGPSEDATVLPRGMVRVAVSPTWGRFHRRFADGHGRAARGDAEALATDYHLDSIGERQLPILTPVNAGLRSILGAAGGIPLSLGSLHARFDATVATTPIAVEYGVTRRLMLGAMFPIVKTRTEVSLNPNAAGTSGTVGINPSFGFAGARATNARVVLELTAAAQSLQLLLQQCAGSTAPSCSAVNADRTGAQTLVTAATTAAAGIESVYGVSAAKPGTRLSPVERSRPQQDVLARLANLSSTFAGFLGAPTSGSDWIVARPVGAPPIGFADFQKTLTDPAFGISADSLASVETNRLGDIELGAKFLLFDTFAGQQAQRVSPQGFNVRIAVAGVYRLGTGVKDSVDHFADIGTGDGQTDVEGRVFADLLVGRRFWTSIVARYGVQQADELTRRVPVAPHDPFPAADRRILLERDLGDFVSLDVSPRYVLSDNIALGGSYQYYSKSADTYSLRATAPTRIDPGVLALGTDRTEQRALASLTWSTMAHYFRGRARTPMEVSIMIGRTFAGANNAPRQSITALTLRVYNQLF
ncbi:MAG: hypothetical protein ACT4P7_16105 [Gemmatimonadaceae bacterium]